MSEYWKSQPRKFCEACKCWIADNKASISFHENGKKHAVNTQKRLDDIYARSAAKDRQLSQEEEWLQKMEAAALKDYRQKDLEGNADLTAKIFNQTKAEREAQRVAAEEQAEKAAEAEAAACASAAETASAAATYPTPSTSGIGPCLPNSVSGGGGVGGFLRTVQAPKTGTKWHKESTSTASKMWYEAKTDDGNTYYWHVKTQASRWDAPPEGYFSIAEQEEVNRKHEDREAKKLSGMYESQAIHGSHVDEADGDVALPQIADDVAPEVGPTARPDPYGKWKAVERTTSASTFDYQTPQVKDAPKANVTLHNDRQMKFKQKSTPSLGGSSSFGSGSGSGGGFAFKKRKLDSENKKNFRRRTDY